MNEPNKEGDFNALEGYKFDSHDDSNDEDASNHSSDLKDDLDDDSKGSRSRS